MKRDLTLSIAALSIPSVRLLSVTSCQLFAVSAVFWGAPALALPQGADIRAGDVAITETARQMQIQQSSQKAIINYDSFNIGADETVNINQPNANSVLVNRVNAGGPMSEIYGQLQSNGQVFLINQAGILVGDSAQINVGGLLLTTHDISDESLLSNDLQFMTSGKPAMVQIDGNITVDPGSFVIVLSEQIDLGGDIIAQFGQVSLVSADGASVLMQPGEWPQIQVTQATYDAWIHQHGLIKAEGGFVEITAASASDLIDRVIYHEGTTDVSTTSFVERDGKVFIETAKTGIAINTNDTSGYAEIAGTIDASGDRADGSQHEIDIEGEAVFITETAEILNNGDQGNGGDTRIIANSLSVAEGSNVEAKGGTQGDGGFVELSGHTELEINGRVDTSAENGQTGELYIDPRNIVINNAATTSMTSNVDSGTNTYSPTNNSAILNVTNLQDALALNNVTVTTADGGAGTQAGNLTVDSDIDIDQANGNTLTLHADNILSINADIEDKTANGTTGSANIVLDATQDIQMNTGTVIDAGNGQITVTTTNGDLVVTQLESDFADGAAVDINVGGSIIDGNDTANNIILNGENAELSMIAGSVIELLEGDIDILTAEAQDVKGFDKTVAGDLQISRVTSSASPLAGFTATTLNGDIVVRGKTAETNPGIDIGSDGRLALDVGGSNDLLIEEDIITSTGAIALNADAGAITMDPEVSITSTSGSVALSSQGSQTISLITTGSTADDAINLTVTGSNDILDADDVNADDEDLVAADGGLVINSVDNFVGLETRVNNFTSENLNVSQIVLNETDDLVVNQIAGNTTGVTIVAGGEVLVDSIDTGGSVSIQADKISEYYEDAADEIAKANVASIAAPSIELIAATSIGEVSDTDMVATDYLDVDTADLRLELTAEITDTDSNEIAVQQVSGASTGDLVVSEIITPQAAGAAKVYIASRNNGIDLSATTLALDATDYLGLQVSKVQNLNPVEILLPALDTVQDWSLAGLSLVARATGTSINTLESAGSTVLSSLITAVDNFVLSTNNDFNLVNFTGDAIDMKTSSGTLRVNSGTAVTIADLNADGDAFVTNDGNLLFAGNGQLSLIDNISATDGLNDETRAGLIDLTTASGNILVGTEGDVTITSTNTQDSDVDGGLGDEPSTQTAIRIAQTGTTGTANITLGDAATTVTVEAQGGDIYMASGLNAVTRDVDERTLTVNENVLVTAYNVNSDTVVAGNTVLDEVDIIDTTAVDPSIASRTDRRISLSSVNIAGFNVDEDVQDDVDDAVDDIDQSQDDINTGTDLDTGTDDESQTRMNVMLETVVPECEAGESLDNSSQCMKKQGFKEFLRSLVIGRGFPDKYKGLPE